VERRRIGLLGATGYTGQRVLRELLARGEEPTLVGRNRSRCWPWPIASKRIVRSQSIWSTQALVICGLTRKSEKAQLVPSQAIWSLLEFGH